MGTRISLCAYTPSPLNNQDLVTTSEISLSVNESEFELIKPHVVYSGIMLGMCRTESRTPIFTYWNNTELDAKNSSVQNLCT